MFEEGELEQQRTCRKFRQVRMEGSREVEGELDHYNLDVIISVGYRVKSPQGTQFRIWATQTIFDSWKTTQVGHLLQTKISWE